MCISETSQTALRSAIRALMANTALGEADRAKRIQALMSGCSYTGATLSKEDSTPVAFSTSYYDEERRILGCSHYQLKAKVLAPCCNQWVPCRFCHDENRRHTMDRFAVSHMKCMLCLEEQPVGQQCKGCQQDMGRYYCSTCRLIDDGPDKDIFHCEQCGICLSGRREDYYHCSVCDACVAVDAREEHSCRENRLKCTCPICDEWLSDSVLSIVQPKCQHLMHESCLSKHMEYSYKCPVCSASLCDTKAIFDLIECYMRCSVMPPEYHGKQSQVFCNDCHRRSTTNYHFLYHRCKACKSYNTNVIGSLNLS
ncbi:hypothetical protein IWW38_000492 [Coemansia aciculifera]|uniref:Uncharacterized protein n=1 Tax=Coemansia aciculifera TaxID=417176 RepID=A0ACC1MAQ7_9FUNG|nr:hypothetical protein IWW38_000492 [Coemansia aciculifera]